MAFKRVRRHRKPRRKMVRKKLIRTRYNRGVKVAQRNYTLVNYGKDIFHYKGAMQKDQITGASVSLFKTVNFSIAQLPMYANLRAMWSQYRVNYVNFRFTFMTNVNVSTRFPTIFVRRNTDPDNTPTATLTEDGMLQYRNVVRKTLTHGSSVSNVLAYKIYRPPNVGAVFSANGAITSKLEYGKWVDFKNDIDTENIFMGIQYYIDFLTTNYIIDLEVDYSISLRYLRLPASLGGHDEGVTGYTGPWLET